MGFRRFTTVLLANDTAWRAPLRGPLHKPVTLADFDFTPEPGMLYVVARAISSRVNANYDGWPAAELRQAFRSFIGRPVFPDHNNWDVERTRGVILDTLLREGKLATGHEDVSAHLLIEVDAQAFPKLAEDIMAGDIDAVSMGADVEYTICSVCSNKAYNKSQFCAHIPKLKGKRVEVADKVAGIKRSVLCYEDCFGVNFFEISFVFDPADESALITDKMLYTGSHLGSTRLRQHVRGRSEGVDLYRRRMHSMARTASVRTADELLMALPEPVDTLRQEAVCPKCGNEWDAIHCNYCGNEEAPPGLDDPEVPEEQSPQAQDGSGGSGPTDQRDQGGNRMSKIHELRQRTGDAGLHGIEQVSAPANDVPQYGQGAGGGQATPPPEPPVATSAGERAQQDQIDPRSLDQYEIVGPPGQSAVTEIADAPKELPEAPPGPPPPATMAKASPAAQKAALKNHAAALEARAAELRKQAEEVMPTSVTQLDQEPPPNVDFAPDGRANLLAPTEEGDQRGLADHTDTVLNGTETGLPLPIDRPQPQNQFQNVGPYQGGVDERSRFIAIANFVDRRIDLGLTAREEKANDFARFEQMSPERLAGWMAATEELEKGQVASARRVVRAGRRQQASTGATRVPRLGESSQVAARKEAQIPEFVAFLGTGS